jgi:hypothetical protein
MKKAIRIAIAVAFLAGTASVAMAQGAGPGSESGNTMGNAASSGGAGTHTTSQKTGSAANTQKVMKNQNGYQPQR